MLGRLSNLFRKSEPEGPGAVVAAPTKAPAASVLSIKAATVVQPLIDPTPVPQTGPHHNNLPVPYYPRLGPAVPSVPPAMIVDTQDDLLRRLRQASSLSFSDFDEYILPVVVRYASFVHLLPASEYDHHSDLGGLYRHGLEVAFNAARRSDGIEFALNEVPSVRKFQVFRWRACAMLGGMLHDLGKAVIDVGASDVSGDKVWNPHVQSLWDWLQENRIEHYNIHWREERRHKEHDAISATALVRMLPEATLRWLGDYRGRLAYDAMLMALAGANNRSNPLVDIIKGADGDSVARDRAEAQKRMASVGEAGSRSFAAQIIRAMRERLLQGRWRVNELGNVVWLTPHGLYAMYPQCLKEALEHLREQGVTSIPNEPPLLLAILREAGAVVANELPNGESLDLHRIKIHAHDDKQGEYIFDMLGIRFANDRVVPDVLTLPSPVFAVRCEPDGKPIDPVPSPPDEKQAQASVSDDAGADTSPVAGTTSAPAMDPPTSDQTSLPMDPPPRSGSSRRMAGGKAAEQRAAVVPARAPDPGRDFAPDELSEDDREAIASGLVTYEVDANGLIIPPPDAPLRDWAAEKDPRDAVIDEARALARDPFPPTSAEGARLWIADQDLGAYLDYLVNCANEGALRWKQDLFEQEGRLLVRYPGALDGCGAEPAVVLDKLANAGWLEINSLHPGKKLVTLVVGNQEPIKALRFNHGVSRTLILLLPPSEPPAEDESKVVGPHIVGRRATLFVRVTTEAIDLPLAGAIVRGAFWDHLDQEFSAANVPLVELTPEQLARQLKAFAQAHGRMPHGKLNTWLCGGEMPMLRKSPGSGLKITGIDPGYDRGADEQVIQQALAKR